MTYETINIAFHVIIWKWVTTLDVQELYQWMWQLGVHIVVERERERERERELRSLCQKFGECKAMSSIHWCGMPMREIWYMVWQKQVTCQDLNPKIC